MFRIQRGWGFLAAVVALATALVGVLLSREPARASNAGFLLQVATTTPVGTGTITTTPVGTATQIPLAANPVPSPYESILASRSQGTYRFGPRTVVARVGTEVTWTNRTGGTLHIASRTPNWNFHATVANKHSVRYVFTRPGRYQYFALHHPSVRGMVVVQATG